MKDGTRNDEEESPVPRTVLSAPLRSASVTVMIIEERDLSRGRSPSSMNEVREAGSGYH